MFGMLVFFTNLSLTGFQVRYLALFFLFSVIDDFGWFWMGSLHKNIQLMLEFVKGSFLVLHFSYYTSMTFLMLSVMLLSMRVILISTLSQIKHLICDNNQNWPLQLNLIYNIVDWGRKCLADFNAGKTQLVSFHWCNNVGTTDVKMDGCVLNEKSSFKVFGLTFSSKLDWGSYIMTTVKNKRFCDILT